MTAASGGTARGKSILVIDDDDGVREILWQLLDSEGYQVLTAVDGADALRQLRQVRPCLILLDLLMPDVSGWQFREVQQRIPELAGIPVVLISGFKDLDAVGPSMGCEVLMKPFELEDLLAIVRQHCG